MDIKRRVVITGMATINPLGDSLAQTNDVATNDQRPTDGLPNLTSRLLGRVFGQVCELRDFPLDDICGFRAR